MGSGSRRHDDEVPQRGVSRRALLASLAGAVGATVLTRHDAVFAQAGAAPPRAGQQARTPGKSDQRGRAPFALRAAPARARAGDAVPLESHSGVARLARRTCALRAGGVAVRVARYMVAWVGALGFAGAVAVVQATWQQPDRFDYGRAPTAAAIAAWDVDVRPDGTRRGGAEIR